ncbi:hypothetical protein WA026_001531 [Henosepilachna vigintioctopunctata]|uniref:Uncharacterized protein n=1 Tax=Henosepilachna vigintioctopunctata TaxID=420089 RepID=A0AAW1URG8_9CUCU
MVGTSADIEKPDKISQGRNDETDTDEEPEDPSFLEEIKIYFRNYCNHTGIHGFQYFGQHRTLIEKIWWVLVFIVTFSMCSFCIYLIYDKWSTSPVIVSLATKETPIYQIPYPAVTICPTIKYRRDCFNKEDEHDFTKRNVTAKKKSYIKGNKLIIVNKGYNATELEKFQSQAIQKEGRSQSPLQVITRTPAQEKKDIDREPTAEFNTIKFNKPEASHKIDLTLEAIKKVGDIAGRLPRTRNESQKTLQGYSHSLCKTSRDLDDDIAPMNEFYTNHFYETLLKCSPFTNRDAPVRFMNTRNLKFKDVFHPIVTEDGICFAFNMMDKKEIYSDETALFPGLGESDKKSTWINQVGYPEDADLETYPRRALLAGGINSLEITLGHFENDIDYVCNGAEQGYKVLLHIPSRVARPTMEYIMVPFNKATTITVVPEMMSTSTRVKKYRPESRNCYFPGEKDLKFYKIYTKNSCDIECLSNYTLIKCKCVAFWMPRQQSTPICGPANLVCVNWARESYDLSNLKDKLKEDRLKKQLAAAKANKTIKSLKFWEQEGQEEADEQIKNLEDKIISVKSKCNCFPICSDLTYAGTASSLDFRWNEQYQNKSQNNTPIQEIVGETQISIFIKTNEVFTRERNELYGPTDFISNFGGLLGLFSGFSILSFMEIVYFLTLRIIGNWKKFGRWYGKED